MHRDTNPHANPALPPKITGVNPKIQSIRLRPGSTDRTHWIEIKIGPQNIAQNEVLCRVNYGSRYVSGLQTIGIPSYPQEWAFSPSNQDESGYDLISSGMNGGSVVSIRPIVVPSMGPL